MGEVSKSDFKKLMKLLEDQNKQLGDIIEELENIYHKLSSIEDALEE